MYNYWKKVENIVEKWEIARFEQFLLLPLCFQKSYAAEASKSVYMRERVKQLWNTCSVISRRFLVKFPVPLVNLSWHQLVSLNANPATLTPTSAAITTIFKVFCMTWPGSEPATSRTHGGLSTTKPQYGLSTQMG